uniref:Uncharacterized protein n=1 Tax=Cacopsylla melanoneura TaxID=428564 RepID=A0A8D8ZD51_9HEMI
MKPVRMKMMLSMKRLKRNIMKRRRMEKKILWVSEEKQDAEKGETGGESTQQEHNTVYCLYGTQHCLRYTTRTRLRLRTEKKEPANKMRSNAGIKLGDRIEER